MRCLEGVSSHIIPQVWHMAGNTPWYQEGSCLFVSCRVPDSTQCLDSSPPTPCQQEQEFLDTNPGHTKKKQGDDPSHISNVQGGSWMATHLAKHKCSRKSSRLGLGVRATKRGTGHDTPSHMPHSAQTADTQNRRYAALDFRSPTALGHDHVCAQ